MRRERTAPRRFWACDVGRGTCRSGSDGRPERGHWRPRGQITQPDCANGGKPMKCVAVIGLVETAVRRVEIQPVSSKACSHRSWPASRYRLNSCTGKLWQQCHISAFSSWRPVNQLAYGRRWCKLGAGTRLGRAPARLLGRFLPRLGAACICRRLSFQITAVRLKTQARVQAKPGSFFSQRPAFFNQSAGGLVPETNLVRSSRNTGERSVNGVAAVRPTSYGALSLPVA